MRVRKLTLQTAGALPTHLVPKTLLYCLQSLKRQADPLLAPGQGTSLLLASLKTSVGSFSFPLPGVCVWHCCHFTHLWLSPHHISIFLASVYSRTSILQAFYILLLLSVMELSSSSLSSLQYFGWFHVSHTFLIHSGFCLLIASLLVFFYSCSAA